ncbi:substrate-binding domain-containing protein [Lentiprolixibacter aurantiacus]|uniref:Substrate-binding domain-containing protein n=1 Tax=Lentiprolixibacter aurantiacus TaxID=2993939 RepID=A0AAE3SPQ0_9FLAO|nr:substrate-binding domain-containing protein [Lentiprolixibacter aurantiacus]MCX2719657.1 substrate-binding domain-containing protein [Lentiprolixibacter aurantiacus]
MIEVRIAGVPEHFNLPWHMAIEEGAFADKGIDLQWEDVPEGTGRMCNMLANEQTDLAITLTEGIVKSIAEGNKVRVLQEYISTPLLWGVHVAYNSPFTDPSELEGGKVAISRYGSGSHLMAFVHAREKGWDTEDLQFEVVNTLDGAVDSLQSGWADYFMWEHFTTKPLVDNNTFRRLEDCPTPWPCFVIAVRQSFLNKNEQLVKEILNTINGYSREFKQIPSIDRTLANRYGQQLDDIREWLSKTRWSQKQLDVLTVDNVIDTLFGLNLISNKIKPGDILTN